MNDELSPYGFQFTVEERKRVIAQSLEEVRKSKGYTQKQVAAFIKVKPTTYSTYESGRTEPPAEILVRLSYLYQTSVDTLVQRNRLHRGALDIQKQLEEYQRQARLMEEQLTANIEDSSTAQSILEGMEKVIDEMRLLNQKLDNQKQAEDSAEE